MFKFHKFVLNQCGGPVRMPLTRVNVFMSTTVVETKPNLNVSDDENSVNRRAPTSKKKSLVSVAFQSLRLEKNAVDFSTPFTDEKIKNATTVDHLLSISHGSGISRQHALKVLAVLAEWTNAGKVKLSDFESDTRFLKLCKILLKKNENRKDKASLASKSEDLYTILNVTAEDEAAQLIENITLSQMVKVMSSLATKKRRSSLLLRTLAYNITANSGQLNIKECSDLLYSMSTLNFIDENLLSRITGDILTRMQDDRPRTSAVIGSIFTSLGLLRYKNIDLLESLSEWVEKSYVVCRPQDTFSMLMTLGQINYIPSNLDKLCEIIKPQLTQSEAGKPLVWLNIVWSLVLLNRATSEQISSVLNSNFIDTLKESDSLNISSKLKLLNIAGAAKYLFKDYSVTQLPPGHNLDDIPNSLSKEKSSLVNSVTDTLKNLISENYLQTRVNSGFGFYIDAVFVLDKKCIPQPVKETNVNPECSRVALMVYGFHDMCIGRVGPTGINALAEKILKANNYKVLSIPYTEFNPTDKILYRVQYLEGKIKEIVNNSG